MTLTLLTDIHSNSKGRERYGSAKDKVKLIAADHYPVLIVEGKKGRFSVRVEKTDYDKK